MTRLYQTQLKARDTTEQLLAKHELPAEFWSKLLKDFSFRSTPFRGSSLSTTAQRKWCEAIVVDPPYTPFFVVASYPTDRGAQALTTWMFRHRMARDRRGVYTNAASVFDYSKTYTSIAIHNVTHNSTEQRYEQVRDIVVAYPEAFRIVTVATKTPEAWTLNHLHLRPTAVFYLKDM